MARIGAIRSASIGLLVSFALGWAAIEAGLRINGTCSFPVGLYLVTHKRSERGDLVFADVPPLPIFEMAKDRGYLNVAYCIVGKILKRLVGVAGDRVTIDATGVQVNGIRLANSTPLPCDACGRTLQAYPLKDYVLGSRRSPADV